MFKFPKGKPTLKEIESDFNSDTFLLGQTEIQISRLQTTKNKILQRLENLTKKALSTKEKVQKEEIQETIKKGPENDASL